MDSEIRLLRSYGIQGSAKRGYRKAEQRRGKVLQRFLPKGGSQMLRPAVAPGAANHQTVLASDTSIV